MHTHENARDTKTDSTPTIFRTVTATEHGRIGELQFRTANRKLETPILYPVINFLTGTSARGGGVWKYILRNFMQRDTPTLSQVLHFLDFNFTGKYLANWRKKSMREHYLEQNGDYQGVLFLDSGGFKLLYNTGLDLSQFGIHKETEADDILEIQLDFEGDIVATLDYPIPPNLARAEAEQRMKRSFDNAYRVAQRLSGKTDMPYLYVCCHGQSGHDIQRYVDNVFEKIGELLPSFGLAVGSLVPLRGKNDSAVMELLNGVVEAIPAARRDNTPIHAFGVSGILTPILAYMGVDTFDSSSYVQASRSLAYSHPQTLKKLKIMEMDAFTCECYVCQSITLDEMQQGFMEEKSYQATSTGKFKSEYYALLSLHNFEMETQLLVDMREAIQADDAIEGLTRHVERFQRGRSIRDAVQWLSTKDFELATRLTRTLVQVPMAAEKATRNPNQLELFPYATTENPTTLIRENEEPTISLDYTPDDFSVPADYQPPAEMEMLLVIPCAGQKPYSLSRTHTLMAKKLQAAFPEKHQRIHKVTLSGLYGPVPEEFEEEEQLVRYDFQLAPQNTAQIQLCATRLIDYLQKYGKRYVFAVGYATSRAYREVLAIAENRCANFVLFPKELKQQRLSEFFRHVHLNALVEEVQKNLAQEKHA